MRIVKRWWLDAINTFLESVCFAIFGMTYCWPVGLRTCDYFVQFE